MSRIVRENIIAPVGVVVAPDKYIYSLDGEMASLNDEINIGDLVFYDPRTNRTVAPGVTMADVPKLAIAVAVDPQRLGYATRLRHVFGNSLDSCGITAVTSEPGRCGCNQVMDFYTDCTYTGETYSVQIETRGDRELDYNLWNTWTKETFTVNLKDYECDSCDDKIDCKAVMCALANKMNSHSKKRNVAKTGKFLQRALKTQVKNRRWAAYPLFDKDTTYNIVHSGTACEDCVHITGIGGMTIDGGAVIPFTGLTVTGDDTKTLKGKQERLVKLINKAFRDNDQTGSAILKQQLTGDGAPCCDFQIVINSCVDHTLVDGAGTVVTGTTVNPFTDSTQTREAHCIGCDPDTSWTPTCGLRVVALGHPITCSCTDPVDRTSWYHRQVRINVPETMNNYARFATREIQAVKVPENLGVQWRKRILDADNGLQGRNYDNWTIDLTGIYMNQRSGTAFTESYNGLECKDTFCSVNIQHNLNFHEKSVTGSHNGARGRSIILFNNKDTALYDAAKLILDPWLESLSCGNFGPIECTVDVDQIEATNYLDTAGGVPDGSANTAGVLGGVADGEAGIDAATDPQANNDTGS